MGDADQTAKLNDVDGQARPADILARVADKSITRLEDLLPLELEPIGLTCNQIVGATRWDIASPALHTLKYVAEMLEEDEAFLRDCSIEMSSEDGCLSAYDGYLAVSRPNQAKLPWQRPTKVQLLA